MIKAYRFKLYPTWEQRQQLRQHGGNSRFLWNYFVVLNRQEYATNKKFVFGYKLITSLPVLKLKYNFLGLSFSQSLQQVGWRFDKALKDFLNGKKGFPICKKKSGSSDCFTVPQKFRIKKKYVFIPKTSQSKAK